ncbi:MAG: sigma 54-interacting transcriptional regulator [candidate division Zixibacteria bacterium]|nr:sigma 54-interacting transcriptional regulator [candidate division Zixibacteria bacterium]
MAVDELIRQKKFDLARRDLAVIEEKDIASEGPDRGMYLSLSADCHLEGGEYRKALDCGLQAAHLLADYSLHVRYARTMLVLSRAYSALGDLKNAELKAYESLASYRRASDQQGQIDAFNELARVAFIHSNFDAAEAFVLDAIGLAADNPRKLALLTGNLGRIRILNGHWVQAESDLTSALDYNRSQRLDNSVAVDLLSLGYLSLRRREFSQAERRFAEAAALIEKLGLKREKIIAAEYAGELACERGDFFKAKTILAEAYHQGRLLAPNSSLVSQAARRLAEVELAMDRLDEAQKYAQIALEVALTLGEKAEVAHARRVVAEVFAAQSAYGDALEYNRQAIELFREVGDPYDLARALVTMADVKMKSGSDEHDKIRAAFDEAARLFRRLKLDFWVAVADFHAGIFSCQRGDLSRGFKKLSRAEKTFQATGDTVQLRNVHQFLASLSEQAVALSISEDNQFKVFGHLLSQSEIRDLQSGQLEEVLSVLVRRTGAHRAIMYVQDTEERPLISSCTLSPAQSRRFGDAFRRLLGAEISVARPTLRLDCRKDPYIRELFADSPEIIASVIVIPFRQSDQTQCFLYLDKLATDNMLNPFGQDELNFAVGFSDIVAFKSAEMQKQKLLEDNRRLKAQLLKEAAFPNFVTRNSQMLEMLAQVRQVVDSNISVTIDGETGSGKDLLARAIHYNSVRRDKRFISVNCAALPETLLESELFGYRRGAYTGADRDKPGLFEEADGGTFFLDEIADMPLSIQAKILRVLEAKELVRLGESVPRKVDVRIISATNKDLKTQMAAGLFRQDLYYRLSALTFHLPSVRERKDDIPLLAAHFLEGSNKRLSSEALKALVSYEWPGNVRELENEIKKAILLAGDKDQIEADVLSGKILSQYHPEASGVSTAAVPVNGDMLFNDAYSLYDFLAMHERNFIIRALRDKGGIKKHAAAALNIPESTLRLKIKQYSIDLNHLDLPN